MAHLRSLGTAIQDQILPTFGHYAPLLCEKASTIQSIPRSSFTYGPTDRHQLDAYMSPNPRIINNRHPVLLFFYGGGFVQGSRTLPVPPLKGLVHANVASFFARNFGFTVIVPDYRLLSHGAEFPSGGEDVALTVDWVHNNSGKFGIASGNDVQGIDLFMIGNSAGGAHVSTFLFSDTFKETRSNVLEGSNTRLRGVVLLSSLFSFDRIEVKAKRETLGKYFKDVENNCPLALMKNAFQSQQGSLDFVEGGTRILLLNSEWDPEDECLGPRDDFIKEWLKHGNAKSRRSLAVDIIMGQNHISPFLGLSTEIACEEYWGHQVGNFFLATISESA